LYNRDFFLIYYKKGTEIKSGILKIQKQEEKLPEKGA